MIIVFGLMVVNVSAIGIAFPGTIIIHPGQSIEESVSLQNLPAGKGDLMFEGTIDNGAEYVSFLNNTYVNVPDGKARDILLNISVPESAKIGDVYKAKILFSSSPVFSDEVDTGGSAVQFNLGTGLSFDIMVTRDPEEETPGGIGMIWVVPVIIAIIILTALIWFFVKRKKESVFVKK